ncbi:MAG: hypothetical protein KatS3mg095_0642 [Candidatus Parcubacteria bacterium]|nr:MAG: hypothetical protein KatS3mg095_0642 [Candidatus Parcubacteria bacterium]
MVITYNIAKEKLEVIEKYIKNKDFQSAKVELTEFYEYLKETISNIVEILNYLENSRVGIKKKIYSLLYYYLYDLELMDEEAVFSTAVDNINGKEFIKESLWERIKNFNINSLEEEINKIDKLLDIPPLIFNFLDYKIYKCGRKIDLSYINEEIIKLK